LGDNPCGGRCTQGGGKESLLQKKVSYGLLERIERRRRLLQKRCVGEEKANMAPSLKKRTYAQGQARHLNRKGTPDPEGERAATSSPSLARRSALRQKLRTVAHDISKIVVQEKKESSKEVLHRLSAIREN